MVSSLPAAILTKMINRSRSASRYLLYSRGGSYQITTLLGITFAIGMSPSLCSWFEDRTSFSSCPISARDRDVETEYHVGASVMLRKFFSPSGSSVVVHCIKPCLAIGDRRIAAAVHSSKLVEPDSENP
jgi:hypothetical protein